MARWDGSRPQNTRQLIVGNFISNPYQGAANQTEAYEPTATHV